MKTLDVFCGMMYKIPDSSVFFSAGLFAANIICILLALNVLSSNFGFVTASSQHLITIFLLLGVVLLNLPLRQAVRHLSKENPHLVQLIIGTLLCLFGFLLLIISKTQLFWICSLPVILSGLDLCLQGMDHRRNELYLLTIASFGYAVVFLLIDTIPTLWHLYQQSSLVITHAIGVLTTTPFLLGPTTSGLNILLVSLVFLISSFLLATRKTRKEIRWFCFCIVASLFIWFFYLLTLNLIAYPSTDALNLHPLFFLFCLIPIFGFLFRSTVKDTASVIIPKKGWLKHSLKNGKVWAVVFFFLSTLLLTVFITGGIPPADQQKVLFYGDHMIGTWDVPEYGKYGKDAVGMFGLWPIYLTTFGYDTEILVENRTQFLEMAQPPAQNITRYVNLTDYTNVREISSITTKAIDNAAIFVVSNLNASFSEQERSIIWDYVDQGGSLLVIGDHTNVGGIQEPLNELLAPVGIQYRFDAALPFDEKFKWLTCTELLHHPITAPLTSLDELQYGIGASLDLSSSSFPIIIGSSVLSDIGNRSNGDIAYLGDYEYNKGEQLGDVILVAGAYYGEGKVLVCGDTSSFQNPALPFSYQFLQTSFTWLASKQTGTMKTLQIGVSLLLLIGAAIVYFFFKKDTISFTWFPFFLCLSLLLSALLNPLVLTSSSDSNPSGNLVYIDASHGERFSLESFTDDSLNGLLINLERNNLQPLILRDFSEEKILNSDLIIFNAPTAAFTTNEVVFLQSYMQRGGVVVLATGYEDKDASLPLLSAFGMDIEPTPLGPVPYVEENLTLYQNEPRFVDAWPVSFQTNQTISFYNFTWGDLTFHLVVFIKHGAGGLLLIGDSQYLLDKNLESIYDYWPGNILFIKYLLDELPITEENR
ncbi:MAG TPA: hypothetical protein VN377_05320 [Candidatus Thermoplasmatota archaeon]|nr:hypothetical protein [Candidatus Thermoplasmatota archaeon]